MQDGIMSAAMDGLKTAENIAKIFLGTEEKNIS